MSNLNEHLNKYHIGVDYGFEEKPVEDRYRKCKNDRNTVIADFVHELNLERKGTKYPPVDPVVIAIKVSHLNIEDLRFFFKKCKNAKKGFGWCFFGALKSR